VSSPTTDTVLAWHAALNAGDVDRLLSLSSADVEVGGPRGSGRGASLLEEWVTRASIQLEPRRIFARGSTVVVEQSARWRADGGTFSAAQAAATVFRVDQDKVASVMRYSDIAAALQAAGLDESDATAVLQ
jgi:ketosteroid isomerase-like protein